MRRAVPQAQKVVAHLQRSGGGGADAPFVWGKKVEKELAGGKKLKEISIFSDKNRQQERLVSDNGCMQHACMHVLHAINGAR
jgi:hypothetical protein